MSNNIYNSKQVIDFDLQNPSVYLGYYLSGTSGSMSVHPFKSEDARTEFEKRVDDFLGEHTSWHIPALLAFSVRGDSESDQACADDLLRSELSEEVLNCLRRLISTSPSWK